MSKFCPEWVLSICAANTAKEFLSSNNSLIGISKKYSSAVNERYDEVKFEEIVDLAEKILQFLSEINAGEEAVDYIMIIFITGLNLNPMEAKGSYQVCSLLHLIL